jgi:hypothetical protein
MAFIHFDREQVIEVLETPDELRDLMLGVAGPEFAPMIQVTLGHEREQILVNARAIRVISDGPVPSRVPIE